ncbi:MAG: hypothetical protein M1608_08660 [Candidatus Omnitrophica bacterium]|nr:hypothetical protein [Candidatus Omnitrophota bacterium]
MKMRFTFNLTMPTNPVRLFVCSSSLDTRFPLWNVGLRIMLSAFLVWWWIPSIQAHEGNVNVSISCGSNGDVSPKGTVVVPKMSDLDITATPDVGYELENWFVDGESMGWSVNAITLHLGDQDEVSVLATFSRITNRVNITVGPDGQLDNGDNGESIFVGWGDTLTLTVRPDLHYHVDIWTVDNQIAQTGGNTFALQSITAEHSVGVSFAPDTYTVQASAGPHGSISPTGAVSIVYGYNQSFSATPDAGCYVAVWWLDGQPVQTNDTEFTLWNVDTNHTVGVTFDAPLLSIELTKTNSVIVSWPAPMDGWQLQESTSALAEDWVDVSAKPEQVNGRNQVLITAPDEKRFYRLYKP